MSKTKQTHRLGKIKQLVDLNQNMTNFDLNFTVTSKDGAEFYAVVVDQTMLDNEPNPEYKKVNGRISGNIVADKGIYQNYFMLLKADKPCECEVVIERKEIPKNPEWDKQITEQPKQEEHPQLDALHVEKTRNESKLKMTIAVVVGVALLGIGLYLFLKTKSKTGDASPPLKNNANVAASIRSESHSVERSPSPSPDYLAHRFASRNEPLFTKFR